ncbi:MAG: transcription antitermination factor NusB [Spirochaetales bacterium]|nr:transcription antitermination factor NusB [Spirochaetales bacterium]
MGSRRKGRIVAFQAIFAWEASHPSREEVLEFLWLDQERKVRLGDDTAMFARYIVSGTLEYLEQIDSAIKAQLEHWDFTRLARVDLAILRISTYALLFQTDIPATVTINEAVDIAKQYGSDESYRFINGILDAIRKSKAGR